MNLISLLSECANYPSGDNAQPFRFKILNGNSFEIFHIAEIARHRLNFKNMTSILSLGTFMETVSLVAKKHNLQCEFILDSEVWKTEKNSAWALVKLSTLRTEASEDDHFLIQKMSQRCVDRRLYSTAELRAEDIKWIEKEASLNSRIQFTYHHKLQPELIEALIKLEPLFWKDFRIAKDIFDWIRFDQKKLEITRDGMNWQSLGLARHLKPVLKMLCDFPKIYQFLTRLGATKSNVKILSNQLRHSGGFGLFAARSTEIIDLIEISRTYFRIWLYLNAKGYAFQPITFSTFTLYQYLTQNLPDDWPKKILNEYPELLKAWKIQCAFDENVIPVWGFRVGWPIAEMPVIARTLRKDIAELIIK